jgi:hypothetical protein
LKVGGEMKVGTAEVVSAVKAALADRVGLYDLPKKIVAEMETFADQMSEPVGKEWMALRKLVVRREYAEVLSVLETEGSLMTDGRKNALLKKLDLQLWSSLNGFYSVLISWQDSWMKTGATPAMLGMIIAASSTGGKFPPGMMQPPDTSGLRAAAEGVIDKINRVFSGLGIPIARALAYDAQRIKEVLANASLPSMLGVSTREQMLKKLGVDVSSDYVRLETSISRFALGVVQLPKVPADSEITYLGALLQLGAAIQWDQLIAVNSNTIPLRPHKY